MSEGTQDLRNVTDKSAVVNTLATRIPNLDMNANNQTAGGLLPDIPSATVKKAEYQFDDVDDGQPQNAFGKKVFQSDEEKQNEKMTGGYF